MILIAHRRNSINELKETPIDFGVEIDIRSYGEQLILQHDPYVLGDNLDIWLKYYKHKTLILNLKEEGLENKLIMLMKKFNIEDYFFLDQSFPFLIKWSKLGERKCAVRVSEFENIATALCLKGRVNWVWVDFFSKFPLTKKDVESLKKADYKICIVSPELQGYDPNTGIESLIDFLKQIELIPDAVCTKFPELWKMFVK